MTETLFDPSAALEVRVCSECGQEKPLLEFYRRRRDGTSTKRLGKCRDCDNGRVRAASIARIVRVRARHRATAELLRRHHAEFLTLLESFTIVVRKEAEQLATVPQAKDVYGPADPVRLRSGPRRDGEDAEARIDLARCPQCISHHSRGHVCTNCGAAPPPEPTKNIPADIPPPGSAPAGICSCGHAGGRHDDDGMCRICQDCPGFIEATA